MKYSVITFGCRVNQADSLAVEEGLRRLGAESSSPDRADLVVVNTCSVTATSDQGARQTIRRIARDNPSARILVTGCYATRAASEVGTLPNVVRVVPNDDKPQLIAIAREHLEPGALSTRDRYGDGDGACGAALEPGIAGRTAFTLRVQTGCAEPCAYCIIPSTRGAPRSLPLSHVLGEVERVRAAGFKEIALTGVHLGSYGRDLSPDSSLLDLLRALDDCNAKASAGRAHVLFRISSLEPMDCTRDIVQLVASSSVFAPHFHLPLQHASDRILAAMRRPYTIAQYAALVDDIRGRMPDASIGADVIVGFPGEETSDFEALAGYLAQSPLTHLHVFPYSDRPGTAATGMGGKVPGAIVRERSRRVREIAGALSARFREAQVGTVQRGLTIDDGSAVVTGNYLKVRIAPARTRNEWVEVRIVGDEAGEVVTSRRMPAPPAAVPPTVSALQR